MKSDGETDRSAPVSTIQHGSSPKTPRLQARASWLGLPHFHWSLTLLGICTFTFVIVTFHLDVAALGIAVGAAGILLQKEKIRLPLPAWLFGAFVVWAFVGSLGSRYPDIALNHVVDYLKLLAIMIVAVNALRTEGQLRFYLLFFLGCFVLFPIRVALVGYAMGGSVSFGRLVSYQAYSNSNDLAAIGLLALGVALALAFSESSRTMVRLSAGFSAMLLILIPLLTQSRGAFIGLMASMGPALILLGAKRPGRMVVYGGIVALIISLTVPSSAWERLAGIEKLTSVSTIADADPEGSAAERFEVLRTGWQIFLDHPVFGVGLGAYPEANAVYAPNIGKRDTHNTYLHLAAEVGAPGLILWLACFGSVLRYAYRSRQLAIPSMLATQQGWIERGLLAFLIAAVFGSYAHLNFAYLMLSALWCSATLLAFSPQRPTSAPRTMNA